MAAETLRFDSWCLLEIMGHAKFAGRVTEETIGGTSFLRIDVPANADGTAEFTKYFSAASVYSITPMAEDLARGLASQLRNAPISLYDLPAEMRAKLTQQKPTVLTSSLDPDHEPDEDAWDDEPF